MRTTIPLLIVVAAVVAFPYVRKSAQQEYVLHTLGKPGDIIWRVKTDRKVVAITLDDGPDPKFTPQVLEAARKEGAKLTFFLVGKEIQFHPDLAKEEVADGHLIGNHTWDHPELDKDSQSQDIAEIERCEDEIEGICGVRTHLFRPPKDLWNGETFDEAEHLGYRMILWSIALEHHTAKTPEAMAKRVLDRVRPGMIILAHDGEPCHPISRAKTVKALPILMKGLKEKGYRMVTVEELLKIGAESGKP